MEDIYHHFIDAKKKLCALYCKILNKKYERIISTGSCLVFFSPDRKRIVSSDQGSNERVDAFSTRRFDSAVVRPANVRLFTTCISLHYNV